MSKRIEAATDALYEHREGALTCYDHDTGWCCVCGTHEILVPWREHAARAVIRATDRAMVSDEAIERACRALDPAYDRSVWWVRQGLQRTVRTVIDALRAEG